MILALVVAIGAVALGLGVGLFPMARRRALGPLRTLALAAVIGVAVFHLLPEALATLGVWGALVFALGLALPRWASRLRDVHAHGAEPSSHAADAHTPAQTDAPASRHVHASARRLGLELGFWGLLVHHVGDGLALGVYSRLDHAGEAHGHLDVLLALVLHTVPLVAVVSAGYARISGTRHAISRSAGLALASVVGIVAAGLVPHELVELVQAWIAAAVAGLLLHSMSHDLTEDLPHDTWGRVVDLAAAALGLTIGWIGANLDSHLPSHASPRFTDDLWRFAQHAALPLLVGLGLGSLLALSPARARRSRLLAGALPGAGAVLGPEALALSLVCFGWRFALVAYALGVACVLLASSPFANATNDATDAPRSLVTHFIDRSDASCPWAFIGVAAAAVLATALPDRALAPLGHTGGTLLAFLTALGLPFHAVLAPLVATGLVGKGLLPGAVLVLVVLGPLLLRRRRLRVSWLAAPLILGVALVVGPVLPLQPWASNRHLASAALALLVLLVLLRAYQRGFRGWLSPLVPSCSEAAHTAPYHRSTEAVSAQP